MFVDAWALFRDPTLAAVVAGFVLGGLGTYVVLRRLVFLTAALSQVAGFGVVAAHFAAAVVPAIAVVVTPWTGSALLSLLAVAALARTTRDGRDRGDVTLGVLYVTGAAATLALATRTTAELHDVSTLLFGTAVAVLPDDLRVLVIASVLVVALHLWLRRGFASVVIDPEDARVRGLPVELLQALLLTTIALMVAIVTRVLGALPAFAFSVLPAVAALRLATSLRAAWLVAGLLGAVAGGGGYVVAYLFDLPVGASQALVAGVLAGLSALIPRAST